MKVEGRLFGEKKKGSRLMGTGRLTGTGGTGEVNGGREGKVHDILQH